MIVFMIGIAMMLFPRRRKPIPPLSTIVVNRELWDQGIVWEVDRD